MKTITVLLVFLLLLQSCSVYSTQATVETAVLAEKRAKVITTDNEKYRFKRLEIQNDRLIGITRNGTVTAGKLAGMPVVIKGKYLEVDLSGLEIEEVKLRNDSASRLLTAGTIIYSVGMVSAIIYLANYSFEVPTFVSPFPTEY